MLEGIASTRSICTKEVPWLNDNRGPEIVTAITIMTLLAIISVILRSIARRVTNIAFGIDDWLIVVSLVTSCGLTALFYIGTPILQGDTRLAH